MLIGLAYVALWTSAIAYARHTRRGEKIFGQAGTVALLTSWGLLTLGLRGRALASGHWPLTNGYEFALCLQWAIITIYLLLEFSWRERCAAPFVLVFALLVATYAITRPTFDKEIRMLSPVLRTFWLQVHVLASLVGYAAFGVAAGLGLTYFIGSSLTTEAGQQVRFLQPRVVESAMERIIALGFPWLSLGILSGAIWAQNAWGRYWGWDPKETWALVTWLWYLMLLHLRTLRAWRGRRLAGLVIAGFGVVLFTYLGVPWLVRTVRLESLHGF